ncbi:MAG: resuscitation-promoting factor RpfB [Acidimicrobiaceae bacterium]|jgi:hypothetical protein|nr:resuscitation-promoting factor RpfB [Acidimicrobiaceae bacterium]
MRGRARLVFSAVTVGGLCAAFVAPSASLAAVSVTHMGPSKSRTPIRAIRSTRFLPKGRSAFPLPERLPGMLPQVALIDFVAPAAIVSPPAAPPPVVPAAVVPVAAVAIATPVAAPISVRPAAVAPVRPRTSPAIGANTSSPGGVWACIRQKESGGNYATNTGNGYYGAYQFSERTWLGIGGSGYPNQAAPAVQDAMAQRLQQRSGWGQWSTHSLCGV